jgi:hypothetical protein
LILLAEAALQQALEGFAVTGFIAGRFMHGAIAGR